VCSPHCAGGAVPRPYAGPGMPVSYKRCPIAPGGAGVEARPLRVFYGLPPLEKGGFFLMKTKITLIFYVPLNPPLEKGTFKSHPR